MAQKGPLIGESVEEDGPRDGEITVIVLLRLQPYRRGRKVILGKEKARDVAGRCITVDWERVTWREGVEGREEGGRELA
jgi:hypothetical protein